MGFFCKSILGVLFFLLQAEVSFSTVPCGRVAIPLNGGYASKGILVTSSVLIIDNDGTFRGEISFRNTTARPFSRLTVLVNYLDRDGSILFSIPFQASLGSEDEDIPNIRPFTKVRLDRPLSPGTEVTLIGRDLLNLTRLPTSAEVAYWFAKRGDDGSSVSTQIGQRGFRTDPLPVEAIETLRVPGSYTEPLQILLNLRINQYGRVSDVLADKINESDKVGDALVQALSELFTRWHFFPAIENGYAVEADLQLLVEFLPQNHLPVKRCSLQNMKPYKTKFAFVTLLPIKNSSGEWIALYGGFPVSEKIEGNVIYETPTSPPTRP